MAKGPPKSSRRPALGRGLSSLITPGSSATTAVTDAPEGRRVLSVPIERVSPGDQPRTHFDGHRLDELAASIKERGVLFPLLVRREGNAYQLIAGERRWRAAQRAGLKEVPVLLDEVDDDEAFELALIENLQREDLNPLEEALGYQRLLDRDGATQASVARLVGKDRSTVANSLRLLRLPDLAREAVVTGRLSMGHARALVALDDAVAIERACRQVLNDELSVRQTEALVRRLKKGQEAKPQRPAPSPAIRDLTERLQRALGTRVTVRDRGNRGKLVIEYGNLDDLDRVVERLLGGR